MLTLNRLFRFSVKIFLVKRCDVSTLSNIEIQSHRLLTVKSIIVIEPFEYTDCCDDD